MGNGAKMCIEPLAFEWCGWYKNEMPKWLTPNQLASAGFCVNASHRLVFFFYILDLSTIGLFPYLQYLPQK